MFILARYRLAARCASRGYIGQERTHLQHVATAAALHVIRSMAWFSGLPRAQTRRSAFARLYDAA